MTSTLKTLTTLAAAAVLVASLTGCIMYVSPDHTYHSDNTPAADEKPAETVSGSKSF